MGQWKLVTGGDCDKLRMAWVMTYLLSVIATRQISPRLWTSDNGNRVTDRWRTIVTKTLNGIRERKIPPRSNKHRDMVVKTRRRQRADVSLRGDLCYDSWSLIITGVVPEYKWPRWLSAIVLWKTWRCGENAHMQIYISICVNLCLHLYYYIWNDIYCICSNSWQLF